MQFGRLVVVVVEVLVVVVVVVVVVVAKEETDTQKTQKKKKQRMKTDKKCALMAISSFIARYITLFCLMWLIVFETTPFVSVLIHV